MLRPSVSYREESEDRTNNEQRTRSSRMLRARQLSVSQRMTNLKEIEDTECSKDLISWKTE